MTDTPREPDWNRSSEWDEFEWEQAFKFSENMSSQYFKMLRRFGDFPNAERLIANELGDINLLKALDDEDSIEMEFDFLNDSDSDSLDSEFDDDDESGSDLFKPIAGDPLFFEACPLYLQDKQVSLGWTNVLSTVLDEKDRMWGMMILFGLGRILSYLSMALGDGVFEPVDESIALGKRVLHQINYILGELDKKEEQYEELFTFIREQLLETRDSTFDFLTDMRKRKKRDKDW